ncbi:hypothetical protein B0I35DRAFT_427495 [Stachybotrys elegans]|uniref:Protein kinase domain-containing protein n=1 Tax=Stachybotrys elegans TaxID=80388 RepID=A0A8K0SUX8_9HYPO|nr:hypothetical protein B0I35DRAFT_427495 [Stachybotrys elegans]
MLEAGDDHEPEVWDYSELVADQFIPDFQRLAPKIVHAGKLTLADLATRGSFKCEYKVVNEQHIPGEVTPCIREQEDYCQDWDMRSIQSSFPLFSPRDVEVPYSDGASINEIIPQKVFVNNKALFYKSCYSPLDAIPEVEKYSKISASGHSQTDLRTSRLFGIVVYPNGGAKGLLYEWIQTDNPGTLTWAVEESVSKDQKEKWASQVESTVARLHGLGIIWGDVKADNVLIDMDNNAVVIDFGGGTTKGWVEHALQGTLEGDTQGMERLLDFILNDNSPLRLRNRAQSEYSDEEDWD